jgi:hypothetical protein
MGRWFELALMVLLYMRAGILVVERSAFAGATRFSTDCEIQHQKMQDPHREQNVEDDKRTGRAPPGPLCPARNKVTQACFNSFS